MLRDGRPSEQKSPLIYSNLLIGPACPIDAKEEKRGNNIRGWKIAYLRGPRSAAPGCTRTLMGQILSARAAMGEEMHFFFLPSAASSSSAEPN